MSSQSHDLHRALLRPFVIHTLRAAGFHGTKPSVLDTLTNLAERHLLLLASTTAKHSLNSHNDLIPTISDVRTAMSECGVLIPLQGGTEETWSEILRRPLDEYATMDGGIGREQAAKRKRETEDVSDMQRFLRWVDGDQHAEIKRVAGMTSDSAAGVVGVGGGLVKEGDFLEKLKKGHSGGASGNDEARLHGTVLAREAEDRSVHIEGGPVQTLRDWRPSNASNLNGTREEGSEDMVMS